VAARTTVARPCRPVTIPGVVACAATVTGIRTVAPRAARLAAYTSVTDARDVEGLAVVELREVELELRVLDGVGGQHVGAQRRHAPLEALAHVPGVVLARAPGREVAREPAGHVPQQPAAQELVGALVGRVAVGARVIALAHAAVE